MEGSAGTFDRDGINERVTPMVVGQVPAAYYLALRAAATHGAGLPSP